MFHIIKKLLPKREAKKNAPSSPSPVIATDFDGWHGASPRNARSEWWWVGRIFSEEMEGVPRGHTPLVAGPSPRRGGRERSERWKGESEAFSLQVVRTGTRRDRTHLTKQLDYHENSFEMVLDRLALHKIDDVFADVCSVIRNSFQMPADQD